MDEETLSDAEATQMFRKLIEANFDFHAITRSGWREICSGDQRPQMQQFLLHLADAARMGNKADRRILYKAAHAVLPLENELLVDLCKQLLAEHPVPLQWCDVLVDVLAEPNSVGSAIVSEILISLRETIQLVDPESEADERYLRVICRQVEATGYRPDWLLQYLEQDEIVKPDNGMAFTNQI